MSRWTPDTTRADSSGSEDGRNRGPKHYILSLSVILAIYVLSMGPVSKLARAGYISNSVEVIYDPLISICKKSPLVARVTVWYLETVWRVH